MRLSPNPEHRFISCALVLTLLATGWWQWISVTQWLAVEVPLHDIGVFNALASGPWHGKWHYFITAPDADANFFGNHLFLIYPVVSLLYGLWDHPLTWMMTMTGALGLAMLPLAFYTRAVTGSERLGLLIPLLFFLNGFTVFLQLIAHIENLAIPFLFMAFLALEKRRWGFYGVSILLTLSVKEDMALWVALFGISLLLERGLMARPVRIAGVATLAGGIIYSYIAGAAMRANGFEVLNAIPGLNLYERYASLGDSGSEIVVSLLTHPLDSARRLLRPPLFLLLLSVGPWCLLDWRGCWVGLAGAAAYLVADVVIVKDLENHYAYAALPFLFRSSARAARWLMERSSRAEVVLAASCLVLGLLQVFLPFSGLPLQRQPFPVTERDRLVREVAGLIPPEDSVAAQFYLITQVPNRHTLLPLGEKYLDRVEWIYVDLAGRAPDLPPDERERVFRRLLVTETDRWEAEMEADGLLLLRRANRAEYSSNP